MIRNRILPQLVIHHRIQLRRFRQQELLIGDLRDLILQLLRHLLNPEIIRQIHALHQDAHHLLGLGIRINQTLVRRNHVPVRRLVINVVPRPLARHLERINVRPPPAPRRPFLPIERRLRPRIENVRQHAPELALRRRAAQLLMIPVRHRLPVHHRHDIFFVMIEKAKLLLNRVEILPMIPRPRRVRAAVRDLRAQKIRQIVAVAHRLGPDLIENRFLLHRTRRRWWRRTNLRGHRRRRRRCGRQMDRFLAQLSQSLRCPRPRPQPFQRFHRLIVEPLLHLHSLQQVIRQQAVILLAMDRIFDEADEFIHSDGALRRGHGHQGQERAHNSPSTHRANQLDVLTFFAGFVVVIGDATGAGATLGGSAF